MVANAIAGRLIDGQVEIAHLLITYQPDQQIKCRNAVFKEESARYYFQICFIWQTLDCDKKHSALYSIVSNYVLIMCCRGLCGYFLLTY